MVLSFKKRLLSNFLKVPNKWRGLWLLGLLALATAHIGARADNASESHALPAPTTAPSQSSGQVTQGQAEASAPPTMKTWRAEQSIPKILLDELVAEVRKEADDDNHRFCLFDTSDRCFFRNAEFKELLKKKLEDYNKKNKTKYTWQKTTATVLIAESGSGGRWSYHTAAVIYTDKGPFVFDPDNKTETEVKDGDLLTPLADWLKVNWAFKRPVTMLAPPGVIVPREVPGNPGYFSDSKRKEEFWDKFAGKVPSDPVFKEVVNLDLTPSRMTYFSNLSSHIVQRSKKNYDDMKVGN